MYQNTIYICISWYSKICWFPVKKCWCQQNSRSVSRDSYIFWIFFAQGITAKFHHCRICVTDFREGGLFWPIPIHEQLQKSPSWIGLRKMFENCSIGNMIQKNIFKIAPSKYTFQIHIFKILFFTFLTLLPVKKKFKVPLFSKLIIYHLICSLPESSESSEEFCKLSIIFYWLFINILTLF